MKILAILCSPSKNGNTATLLNRALEGAKQEGAEVELFSVAGKDIKPCDECRACAKTGKCVVKDDAEPLFEKMLAADGIIFGAPVFFYGMAAQAKAIIDRTTALAVPGRTLANKVGGVVTVAGSLGLVDVVKDFCFYFFSRRMLMANYVAAYSINPEELKKMEKCMQAAYDLGRTMAVLAKANFKYPVDLMGRAIAYGTHTK
ncbi:MAG: flavodoxin family protein [Dehalococcoidales bacterium]